MRNFHKFPVCTHSVARSNHCEFYSQEREGELAIECRRHLAVVFLGWLSKKVFINLGVWLTRAIPLSDGKTTSSYSMNPHMRNWLWRGHCLWRSLEAFMICFEKWTLRTEMSTSGTFLFQTGRHYLKHKNQSTQGQSVMPAKFITFPFSLFFQTLCSSRHKS